MRSKEKDETLMISQVWTYMGATLHDETGDDSSV
jgi:hypothetical protein